MYRMPPRDLLEDLHEFPGRYMFKVIGRVEQGFVARTVAVVREVLCLEIDPPFSIRESAHGRHVAVTLEPEVESAQQVLEIYQRLHALDGLVYLW